MLTRRTMFKTVAALAATALVPLAFWRAGQAETPHKAWRQEVGRDWSVKHEFRTQSPVFASGGTISDQIDREIANQLRNAGRIAGEAEFRAFYNLKGATHA